MRIARFGSAPAPEIFESGSVVILGRLYLTDVASLYSVNSAALR